jgi:hypothetical protein
VGGFVRDLCGRRGEGVLFEIGARGGCARRGGSGWGGGGCVRRGGSGRIGYEFGQERESSG